MKTKNGPNIIKPNITFTQIMAHMEAEELIGKKPMIFYSTYSHWWTHSPDDLQFFKIPETPKNHPEYKKLEALRAIANRGDTPKDPSGAPLMQTEDWREWMEAAKRDPKFFGEFGVSLFMAAHHRNHELYGPGGARMTPSNWTVFSRWFVMCYGNQNLEKFI